MNSDTRYFNDYSSVRPEIASIFEEIRDYRRMLHKNPQTAFEETFAAELIKKKLTEWGVEFVSEIAETGVVATIHGNLPDNGRSIGLRADIDALNIEEKSDKEWKSKITGKMHACGHDGHTAMLLGAAKYLSEHKNFAGKVHLIFQPAEEGEGGAKKMIAEGLFNRFPCQAIYGMHNWPYCEIGKIAVTAGAVMAASDTFKLVIKGKGGHAAFPHECIDPLIIGSQIVCALQNIVSRNLNPIDTAVVSVTNFNAGTGADNIIADNALITGSVRSFKPETRNMLEERIQDICLKICQANNAECEFEYIKITDSTINEPTQTEFCRKIATSIFGSENVITDAQPCMGAEDFGAMLAEVPGCYVWVGSGSPDKSGNVSNFCLHHPEFDFNDEIIPIGIEYWVRIVEG